MKHLLLFLVFCMLAWEGYAQNDWKESGYKGKVKKVEHTRFLHVENQGKNNYTVDSNFNRSIQVFNKEGNFDSIIFYSKNSDNEESKFSIKVFSYTNGKKTGWIEKGRDNEILNWGSLDGVSDSLCKERTFDLHGDLVRETNIHFNSRGKMFQMEVTSYAEGIEIYNQMIHFYGPENGAADSIVTVTPGKELMETTYFQALELDTKGNSTKTLVIRNEQKMISVRKYEYFE